MEENQTSMNDLFFSPQRETHYWSNDKEVQLCFHFVVFLQTLVIYM